MKPLRPLAGIAGVLAGTLLLAPVGATATDRVYRVFDQQHGLPTDVVTDVAQDPAGFLWIATPGGLVRFDGDEMRLWEGSARAVTIVRTGPDGTVLAVDDRARILRVDPSGGLEELRGPDGTSIDAVVDISFDSAGALWIVRAEQVMRYTADGTWLRLPRDRFGDATLRRVEADGDAGVFILTSDAVWSARSDGEIRRELETPFPVDVLRQPDGALMVLGADVFLARKDGERTSLLEAAARPIDLLARKGGTWVSFDRMIAQLVPGEPPALIGQEHGLPSGGKLFVDREGSLWVCSFRGLIQFPEPDAVVWTERHGLPSTHARFLARNPEALWASTWGGLARLDADAGRWRVPETGALHMGEICVDDRAGVWYGGAALHERRYGTTTVHPFPAAALRFCTPSHDGTVWLGMGTSLLKAGPDRVERIPLPSMELPAGPVAAPLLEDRAGRLWTAYPGQLCRADVVEIRRPGAWNCERLPVGVQAAAMLDVGEGLWLGTEADGVFRRDGNSWHPIPGSRGLGGGRVFKLRPGESDSVWILGLGRPTRVVDRPGSAEGWEVVEVLSGWHGHPSGGASDLIEEADGTVWTASAAGISRIPGHARRRLRLPPSVELSGASVDGRAVPIDEPLRLGHRRNLVELRFAALTYRDRSLIRYQVRLAHREDWTDLAAGNPVFRFAELPAGAYVAEFRASLDGRTWSANTKRLAFHVSSPWYLQPWFIAILTLAVGGVLLAIHRARLRLAVRLERQRTQIAMDLHDEIGSGLGSIGILAGIADARTTDPRSRTILRDIADTTADLSTSLGDIVWSLRSRSGTLQELAERLAERGHRLFPAGEPAFVCDIPELPEPVPLSLAVQRNVLLVAVEALHNAATHAAARGVELAFTPAGTRWRIRVADDGRGFSVEADRASRGLGLRSMRRRASEIGAALDIRSTPGGGTTVVLLFDPGGQLSPAPGSRMRMRGEGAP